MYNYANTESKKARIQELKKLITITGDIPPEHLSSIAGKTIQTYLSDIIHDLESQIHPEPKRKSKLHESVYKSMDEIIRRTLDRYYAEHKTKDLIMLKDYARSCQEEGLTVTEIPVLGELMEALGEFVQG